MASNLSDTLTPSELCFIAENDLVEVLPRQRLTSHDLIGIKTPELRPLRRTKVPLWLAILLKRQQRATIIPPTWLSEDILSNCLREEESVETTFSSIVPPKWLEVAIQILKV